jgi:hypothetical protein
MRAASRRDGQTHAHARPNLHASPSLHARSSCPVCPPLRCRLCVCVCVACADGGRGQLAEVQPSVPPHAGGQQLRGHKRCVRAHVLCAVYVLRVPDTPAAAARAGCVCLPHACTTPGTCADTLPHRARVPAASASSAAACERRHVPAELWLSVTAGRGPAEAAAATGCLATKKRGRVCSENPDGSRRRGLSRVARGA